MFKCLLGKPHTKTFNLGIWQRASEAKLHGKHIMQAYQIDHNYKFSRLITCWENRDTSWCIAAFSNEMLNIADATDEVINLIVKDLYPHLLIHPDARVRAIAEKVSKENHNDET